MHFHICLTHERLKGIHNNGLDKHSKLFECCICGWYTSRVYTITIIHAFIVLADLTAKFIEKHRKIQYASKWYIHVLVHSLYVHTNIEMGWKSRVQK